MQNEQLDQNLPFLFKVSHEMITIRDENGSSIFSFFPVSIHKNKGFGFNLNWIPTSNY